MLTFGKCGFSRNEDFKICGFSENVDFLEMRISKKGGFSRNDDFMTSH